MIIDQIVCRAIPLSDCALKRQGELYRREQLKARLMELLKAANGVSIGVKFMQVEASQRPCLICGANHPNMWVLHKLLDDGSAKPSNTFVYCPEHYLTYIASDDTGGQD